MNQTTTNSAITRRALLAGAAALAASRLPSARAHDATPAAMGGMDGMSGTGAVYLTVANAGEESDRLLGGSTPAAAAVEIHEMADDNGTMVMRPLADGLEIPAGGSVALEPGGYHIMLIGLTGPLTPGAKIALTLAFENAGEVTLEAPVLHARDAGSVASAPVTAGDLTIDLAWARPAPAMGAGMGTPGAGAGMHGGMSGGMQGTGAVYMTIANNGAEADRLLGGSADAAAAVEIHEMADDNGTMVMRPLPDGLEIPAGGSVELEPGGYHVMLVGLAESLMPGQMLSLELRFEKAGTVSLEVPVVRQRDAAALASAPVAAGSLTIDKAWARPAPVTGSAATPSA